MKICLRMTSMSKPFNSACYCYSLKYQLLYCSLERQGRNNALPDTFLTLQLLISTSCFLSSFRQLVIFASCEDCFAKFKSDLNPNSHVDIFCGSQLYKTSRMTCCFVCNLFRRLSQGGLIMQRCIVVPCVLVYGVLNKYCYTQLFKHQYLLVQRYYALISVCIKM